MTTKTNTLYGSTATIDLKVDGKALETLNDKSLEFTTGKIILVDEKTGTEAEIDFNSFDVTQMSMLAQKYLLDNGKSGRFINIVE